MRSVFNCERPCNAKETKHCRGKPRDQTKETKRPRDQQIVAGGSAGLFSRGVFRPAGRLEVVVRHRPGSRGLIRAIQRNTHTPTRQHSDNAHTHIMHTNHAQQTAQHTAQHTTHTPTRSHSDNTQTMHTQKNRHTNSHTHVDNTPIDPPLNPPPLLPLLPLLSKGSHTHTQRTNTPHTPARGQSNAASNSPVDCRASRTTPRPPPRRPAAGTRTARGQLKTSQHCSVLLNTQHSESNSSNKNNNINNNNINNSTQHNASWDRFQQTKFC